MAGEATERDGGAGALPAQAEGAQVSPGSEDRIAVPSGQEITLQDVIWNEPGPLGLTLRFRFLAPQIARDGGTIPPEVALDDMLALCTAYALPRIDEFGPMPAQIIISLSDRAVPFGEPAPDATQFFEAYRIEDGACIWEMY